MMPDFIERFSLTGQRALVTGASKGIGAEICKVLADAGADIVAVARDEAGLEEARTAAEAAGRECLPVVADLTTIDGPQRAAQRALDHFGTIDILVNNAGTTTTDSILDTKMEDWDRIMAVNTRAPFLLIQALGPQMIAQKRGKIVNVTSQTSAVALEDHAVYAGSKHALNAITKCVTAEWARHNIQCNAVLPTVILTPMGEKVWGDLAKGDPMKAKIPAGRFGTVTEVADLVLFLSSRASDMINGSLVFLDGGYTSL